MMDWISFYDFKHSVIYVNARHRDVHYRTIAEDIAKHVPSKDANVLDYGCGEATSAALLADASGHLTMVEAAPNVRAALKARYEANPKISVLTPDEAAALAPGSFDLIVMHSVAQYLSDAELDRLLGVFHRLSSRKARYRRRYCAADIGGAGGGAGAAALRSRQRLLLGRVGGLMRIFVSDYFRLKKTHGLSHYTEAAMLQRLTRAGYTAKRAAKISATISSA